MIDAVVACGSCTLCCRGRHLVLLVPGKDDPRLYKTQRSKGPDGDYIALAFQPNGDCAHLIEGKCSVYDHRPTLCKAYSCIDDYLTTPRAERRRREKAGIAGAAVYARGRELHEGGQ